MAVEPAGVALAVFGFLRPLFDSCRDLYKGYKLTQTFGHDFKLARRGLRVQTVRFEEISKRDLSYVKTTMNAHDPNDQMTSAVRDQLIVIKGYFDDVYQLLKKYNDQVAFESVELPQLCCSDEAHDCEEAELNQANEGGKKSTTPANAGQPNSPGPPEPSLKRPRESVTHVLRNLRPRTARQGTEDEESSSAVPVSTADTLVPRQTVNTFNTPGTTQTPPPNCSASVLNTEGVLAGSDARLQEARRLQQSNSFFRKVLWVDEDRDLLFKRIDDLRTGNGDLEWLLVHRSTREPEKMLPYLQPDRNSKFSNLSQTRSLLEGLDDALASANGIDHHDSLVIDVQIIEDPLDTTRDAVQEGNLSFESFSHSFILRALVPGERTATQILAKPHQGNNASFLEARPSLISNLKAAIGASGATATTNDYEPLGFISSTTTFGHESPRGAIKLFYDTRNQWTSTQTLDDILLSDNFKQRIERIQRSQLARLLAMGALNFFLVSKSPQSDLHPSTVRYYHLASEGEYAWEPDASFILSPYLRIGFGSRVPKRPLGTSGLSRHKANPILDLGLLLFQVGACRPLKYDSRTGSHRNFHAARLEAIKYIHEVDCMAGPGFAEIVEACLAWEGGSSYSDQKATNFVKRVVVNLEQLEKELEESIVD